MVRQWTTKEIQYLKSNALLAETKEVLNMNEMAKKLKRSTAAVSKKISNLRKNGELPSIDRSKAFDSKRRPWTSDEDKKLIAMKKRGATHKEISEVLDRTITSINYRSHRLTKKKKISANRVSWSKEQIQMLIENVTFDDNGFVNNYSELSRIIGKRYEQVQTKVARLRRDGLITVTPKEGTTSLKSKDAMNRFNDARFAHVPKKEEGIMPSIESQPTMESVSIESRNINVILTTIVINGQKIKQYFTQDGELITTKKEPTSSANEVSHKQNTLT